MRLPQIATAAAALLAFSALRSHEVQPQSLTTIDERAICQRCRIDIQSEVVISGGDRRFDQPPIAVTADGRGRFWITEPNQLVRVFDRSGRLLGEVGRRGQGPGEFSNPFGLAAMPGDSMLVFDGRDRLAHVLSADLRVTRSIRLPAFLYPAAVLSWPTKVILAGTVSTPQAAGLPTHIVTFANEEANVLKSVGYDRGQVLPGEQQSMQQLFGGATAAGFWMVDMYRYRFSKWTAAGQMVAAYERRPAWFIGTSKSWIGDPTTPPPPRVAGLTVDAAGLIWVAVKVPSSRWRDAWPKIRAGTTELASRSVNLSALFDTVIEVIDPRAHTLLVSRRFERYAPTVLPDGRIVFYEEAPDGEPSLHIVTFAMRR